MAYFHRAKAAELLALFDQQFPQSERRAGLRAELLQAFATYGDNEGVLARRPGISHGVSGFSRPHAGLAVDGGGVRPHAIRPSRNSRLTMLCSQELAQRAEGVPIGESARSRGRDLTGFMGPSRRRIRLASLVQSGAGASPEYARVLDLYIARLLALERLPDALALYAREIQRNPDDPGLYERLAAFLEQNGLSQQVEAVYQRAIGRFQDASWHNKLARWYLRLQRTQEFAKLTAAGDPDVFRD